MKITDRAKWQWLPRIKRTIYIGANDIHSWKQVDGGLGQRIELEKIEGMCTHRAQRAFRTHPESVFVVSGF